MTIRTADDTASPDRLPLCWCCGNRKPEGGLLRLGARPEAAVCIECVTHLRQRARGQADAPSLVRHLHATADRIRDVVTTAGLHRRPVIGPALRWVNRRSPF